MMRQELSHQAAPQEARQRSSPPPQGAAHGEWDRHSHHHPEQMGAADEHDQTILKQMTTVLAGVSLGLGEDPAEMGVEEAVERAMGVAGAISQRMMLGMRCRPLDGVPLQSHRAEDEQDGLYGGVVHEAAMGEHAMITHRHPNG